MKKGHFFLALAGLVLGFSPLLFAQGLSEEEAKALFKLRAAAEERQAAEDPGYLVQLLGETAEKTGLLDQRPAVRAASAGIICELAAKGQSSRLFDALWQAGKKEAGAAAKDAILLAAVKLKYKFSEEGQGPGLISGFISDPVLCADPLSAAMEFCLQQAEDEGMAAALPAIAALRSKLPPDDDTGLKRLEQASRITGRRSQYPGESLFEAVLEDKVPLDGWVIRALFKQNNSQTQKYANKFLMKLLAEKNGEGMAGFNQLMQEKGILRSENLNPGLEFSAYGLPDGWEMAPAERVVYPAPDNQANSYLRGIAINNPDEAGQASISTRSAVEFGLQAPAAIEFGLAYKTGCAAGCRPFFKNDVLYLFCDGKAEPQGKASIRMEAEVTLDNGIKESAGAGKEAPSAFGEWEELQGKYNAPAGRKVKSVKLTVIAQGRPVIYLDDIYVRRAEEELVILPPQVKGIAAPELALAGEYVLLSAEAQGAIPGEKLTFNWHSNLEGRLGNGRQITACFSRAGEHTLFFSAANEFGVGDFLTAKIRVLFPELALTKNTLDYYGYHGNRPEQAPVIFLRMKGLEGYMDKLGLKTYLYANGALVHTQDTPDWDYTLDTTFLPDGANKLAAVAMVKRKAGNAARLFYSAPLYLWVNNGNWCKIPRISSPQAGAKISGNIQLAVSITSPQLPRVVKYFLSDQRNNRLFICKSSKAPDYSCKLVAGNYSRGEYQLTAEAYYPAGSGDKAAQSAPVRVFIEGRPEPAASKN